METSGIYIHIPFCISKCPYCNFTSFTPEKVPEVEYLSALLKEIRTRYRDIASSGVSTIYFGGGTPSLISPAGISVILSELAGKFHLEDPEITLEANPGTVDLKKLQGFRKAGINRLSIGIQSFNDRLLNNLGRSHSNKEACDAVESARSAGFDNIGIDLIHSIRGESLQDWNDDLRDALSLHPEHISAYNLTIEEGTAFHLSQERGSLLLPSEQEQTDMLLETIEILSTSGYEHYEVSNYALSGLRSRHNQLYWKGRSYIGFGVSAHSYFKRGWGVRTANSHDLIDYLNRIDKNGTAVIEEDILTKQSAIGEAVFLGLRMTEGINVQDFENRFGIHIESEYKDAIEGLIAEDFLIYDKDYLKLTRKGLLFSNDVAIRFV